METTARTCLNAALLEGNFVTKSHDLISRYRNHLMRMCDFKCSIGDDVSSEVHEEEKGFERNVNSSSSSSSSRRRRRSSV